MDDDFETVSIFNNYITYMEKYNSIYIAISNSVKNKWVGRGLPEDKIKLIYDGVKTDQLIKTQEKKGFSMIFLGGYCKNKGQQELIEALGKLPLNIREKIKVDFYGNGNQKYKENLQKKIEKYSLKNVKINNYDPNIYSKISNYTIGVNCSKAEGFGRVTVEYMLAGTCPLISNTGANTELVDDRKTGIIYKYNDLEDLKNKIIFIYNNLEDIHNMSIEARKIAEEKFSITLHAKKVFDLYKNIVTKE